MHDQNVRRVGGMLRMAQRLREYAKDAGTSTYALARAAHDLEEHAAHLAPPAA
jgi:hypothetical protein